MPSLMSMANMSTSSLPCGGGMFLLPVENSSIISLRYPRKQHFSPSPKGVLASSCSRYSTRVLTPVSHVNLLIMNAAAMQLLYLSKLVRMATQAALPSNSLSPITPTILLQYSSNFRLFCSVRNEQLSAAILAIPSTPLLPSLSPSSTYICMAISAGSVLAVFSAVLTGSMSVIALQSCKMERQRVLLWWQKRVRERRAQVKRAQSKCAGWCWRQFRRMVGRSSRKAQSKMWKRIQLIWGCKWWVQTQRPVYWVVMGSWPKKACASCQRQSSLSLMTKYEILAN